MICQQLVGLFMILRQMAHSQTKRRTKMKNQNTLTKILLFVICSLLIVFYSCDDGTGKGKEEPPTVPQPKTITQNEGLAFTGKVTISTSDLYTVAEWDAVVQKVIAALNRGYNSDTGAMNKAVFADVFNSNINTRPEIEVIVSKSTSHNVEVKRGEPNKLYLKESSLDTVNVKDAVWIMSEGLGYIDGTEVEYQAKTTPAKNRVFLAYMFPHSGNVIVS
jgi:hypothetical protein